MGGIILPPIWCIYSVFCFDIYEILQNYEQKRRSSAAELHLSGLSHFNGTAPGSLNIDTCSGDLIELFGEFLQVGVERRQAALQLGGVYLVV